MSTAAGQVAIDDPMMRTCTIVDSDLSCHFELLTTLKRRRRNFIGAWDLLCGQASLRDGCVITLLYVRNIGTPLYGIELI